MILLPVKLNFQPFRKWSVRKFHESPVNKTKTGRKQSFVHVYVILMRIVQTLNGKDARTYALDQGVRCVAFYIVLLKPQHFHVHANQLGNKKAVIMALWRSPFILTHNFVKTYGPMITSVHKAYTLAFLWMYYSKCGNFACDRVFQPKISLKLRWTWSIKWSARQRIDSLEFFSTSLRMCIISTYQSIRGSKTIHCCSN